MGKGWEIQPKKWLNNKTRGRGKQWEPMQVDLSKVGSPRNQNNAQIFNFYCWYIILKFLHTYVHIYIYIHNTYVYMYICIYVYIVHVLDIHVQWIYMYNKYVLYIYICILYISGKICIEYIYIYIYVNRRISNMDMEYHHVFPSSKHAIFGSKTNIERVGSWEMRILVPITLW